MFGVALDVQVDDFKRLLKAPKSAVVGVISQFLVLPFVTYLLVVVLKPQPSVALGMMLVAACPGGNISNFMTSLAGGNIALSVSLTAFSTIGALIMTPINLTFWASLYAPTNELLNAVSLDPVELTKTIVLILGMPLILGMVVRRKYYQLSLVLKKWLRPISLIIFIFFVLIGFYKNRDLFLEYFQYIVYIVLFHNAVALLTGYSIASLFKLSLEDKKSITIETGIQNSGLGLLLIFTFFEGLGGMAMITAWWGIWHIIAGLFVGTIWSRKMNLESA